MKEMKVHFKTIQVLVTVGIVAMATACAVEMSDTLTLDQEATAAALGLNEVTRIPGKVEAEVFADFKDATSGHFGNCGSGPVDQQVTTDAGGGCNVGWTVPGEWLEYDVEALRDGNFDITLRLAALSAGKRIQVSVDGKSVGVLTAPGKGWQFWEDRTLSSVPLKAGGATVRITFLDGATNLNWLAFDVSTGTVGALPHTCTTPVGYKVVKSLSAFIATLDDNNAKVSLAPGTYKVGTKDTGLFTTTSLGGATLFSITASNSVYDLSCVKIEVDTALFQAFGNTEVTEVHFLGGGSTLRNLTIEDVGETAPRKTALGFRMDGKDNAIEGVHMTVRGSQPYGLGDAYGKGSGNVISHNKHAAVLIRGLRNTLRQTTIIHRSYGHGVFMQAAVDARIDGVYLEGELRSTKEMLAANDPRFAAADARAKGVGFFTVWDYKLPSGYWMSLQEDGIRAYNGGTTIVDGKTIQRGTDTVTLLNTVVKHMRAGVALGFSTGDVYVENTTLIGCENGFGVGNGQVVNSYATADVGPAIVADESNGSYEVTILPTTASTNGEGLLAYLSGSGHNITLRGSTSTTKSDLDIFVSGDRDSIRHLYGALPQQDNLTANKIKITNLTNYPLVLNSGSSNTTGTSTGKITNKGTGNRVVQN